jgi:hypothetical protein
MLLITKAADTAEPIVTLLDIRSLNHEWRSLMDVGLLCEARLDPDCSWASGVPCAPAYECSLITWDVMRLVLVVIKPA